MPTNPQREAQELAMGEGLVGRLKRASFEGPGVQAAWAKSPDKAGDERAPVEAPAPSAESPIDEDTETLQVEAEFRRAGIDLGVEIWRIENGACVKKSPNDKIVASNKADSPPRAGWLAHQGKLCEEDSYIFLRTTKETGLHQVLRNVWRIFYWRGAKASAEEYESMTYKLLELEAAIAPGVPQYHISQGSEPNEFLAMFPGGVSYIHGGFINGFNGRWMKTSDQQRLLQVKGLRNIAIEQIPISPKEISSGDCYIFQKSRSDGPVRVIVWLGNESSEQEQAAARATAEYICNVTLAGRSIAKVIKEKSTDELKFWDAIGFPLKANIFNDGEAEGAEPQGAQKPVSNDASYEKTMASGIRLFHLASASGRKVQIEIGLRPFKHSFLKPNPGDVFLLWTVTAGVFAWTRSGVPQKEAIQSAHFAMKFMKDNDLVESPLCRITAGSEPEVFQKYFVGWPQPKGMANTGGIKSAPQLLEEGNVILGSGRHMAGSTSKKWAESPDGKYMRTDLRKDHDEWEPPVGHPLHPASKISDDTTGHETHPLIAAVKLKKYEPPPIEEVEEASSKPKGGRAKKKK